MIKLKLCIYDILSLNIEGHIRSLLFLNFQFFLDVSFIDLISVIIEFYMNAKIINTQVFNKRMNNLLISEYNIKDFWERIVPYSIRRKKIVKIYWIT